MSNMKYIRYVTNPDFILPYPEQSMNIRVPIDALLERHGRSFYWLAKETGVSYSTLWRLKKGKALGINFATLEKLCQTLGCTPGDLLTLAKNEPEAKKTRRKSSSVI
jgi:putative transcriptional regulator